MQPGRPASRRRGVGGTEAAVAWGCRAPSRGPGRQRVARGPDRRAPGSHCQGLQRGAIPRHPELPRGPLDHHRRYQRCSRRREVFLAKRLRPRPSSTTRRAQRSPGRPQATGPQGDDIQVRRGGSVNRGRGGHGRCPVRTGQGQQRQGGRQALAARAVAQGAGLVQGTNQGKPDAGKPGAVLPHTRCFRDVWYAGWRPPPQAAIPTPPPGPSYLRPHRVPAEGPRPHRHPRPLQIRLHPIQAQTRS